MSRIWSHLDQLGRRAFLQHCARTAFGLSVVSGLSVPAWAAGAATASAKAKEKGFGKATRIINLFMAGGMSQLDTFDPKPGAVKGPANPIATTGDFQVTSYLPKTAKIAKHLCVLRSLTAKVGVHGPASYVMRTGFTERGTIRHPFLGAWAQHYLGKSHDTLPSSVCINRRADQGQGFFPVSYAPLAIHEAESGLPYSSPLVKDAEFNKRYALLEQLDKDFEKQISDSNVQSYNDYYDGAVRLMQSSDVEAFDLRKESAAMHEAYGKTNFGQGCLLARRLVAAGVRYVEVKYDGWDLHKDLEGGMEDLCPTFDHVYSALITDLAQQGLLDSTLVVVSTEFGRMPQMSGGGRRHYPSCFSTVLAGGKILILSRAD